MGKSVMDAIDAAARVIGGATLRAVDYLRVSTEQQTKGFGIAYTGRETAAFITEKGWTHVDTFKDEGESGTLPWQKRKGAAEIMDLAMRSPRPFDVVVVFESRAIGRKNRVFWEWVWKLKDLGVFVAIVDEDIDNTTEEGEARMQDKANEDFKELAKIRKRTQGGIQQKAIMGGFPGGQARYGYRIKNKGQKGKQRLVLDVCDGEENCTRTDPCETIHEADVLRRGRDLVVWHKGNWRKAAKYLNAEGFVARSGKPWSHANLRSRIMDEDLLNARYVFRSEKNAKLTLEGKPVWGKSVVLPLDPMFTDEEIAELRAVTAKPKRSSTIPGRVYTMSGRIISLCGKHYVGGSSAASTTTHYRCNGKTEAYPGAPTCDCSQIDARGVEKWAWDSVCDLLGDRKRLKALAGEWFEKHSNHQVDFSSRIARLDQQITEKNDAIDITMAVAAKSAVRRKLTGAAAEAYVESALKPLYDELGELERTRSEIAGWQREAAQAEQNLKDLETLANVASKRLGTQSLEQQAELLDRLDIKSRITGPVPPMRKGVSCTVADWFRERDRLVPVLSDEAWAAVEPVLPVSKGKLSSRQILDAFLDKAISGDTWPIIAERHGSTRLRAAWNQWGTSGLWEAAMEALRAFDGLPAASPHPLPPMELVGVVKPGLILAGSGVLEGHGPELGPSERFSNVAYRFVLTVAA